VLLLMDTNAAHVLGDVVLLLVMVTGTVGIVGLLVYGLRQP
jgi:hypothetical protein